MNVKSTQRKPQNYLYVETWEVENTVGLAQAQYAKKGKIVK